MRYLYGEISIGAAHDDDMTLPCPATSLAGAKVLPGLRSIFEDDEDHWWPKPLPESQRFRAGQQNQPQMARPVVS